MTIQGDVWRAECVAGLQLNYEDDGLRTIIEIHFAGHGSTVEYEHDSEQECVDEYKRLICEWIAELRRSL